MSSAGAAENPKPEEKAAVVTDLPVASRKSYRRKYRKIMVTFEEKMRESNTLFKEEQRILDISQRLAEQTDQLLQLLLELNSCPQVPPRLRYDLTLTDEDETMRSSSGPTISEDDANLELQKARGQLQAGTTTLTEYKESEAALLQSIQLAPTRSYLSLLSHTPLPSQSVRRTDPHNTVPCGFLSIKQEEQHLLSLDAFLDGTTTTPRPHATNGLGGRTAEKTSERERETQLRNPVSVYNWLRRHQPQVFLQDNETGTEKTPRAAGSRSSARKSTTKDMIKQENELYDDDGVAKEHGQSSRGKRKRDEDGGYRPKGGASRGAKRRKETKDEPARSKRGKKMSVDAR